MPKYVVGIDVGGTNTDAVLLDPSRSVDNTFVVAWNKQLTTPNVSKGIVSSLSKLFQGDTEVYKKDVLSVTIGTTHFINAIVERDQARLEKVAVLRLCGPYSRNASPFTDFPRDLANLLNGYVGYLKGGFHVDGSTIDDIDEMEVIQHAKEISKLKINAVVISGIFSPVFNQQELKVLNILQRELPDADIVPSSELSGIGLLERENLSILNASVKRFASKIIKMFARAVKDSGINAPIMLTQNDGTVLTVDEALRIPIKTFSSGTTNSMRGASFLLNKFAGQAVIVVDVGGTTTDVGLLLPNGYPRKTSSYSLIGGVKTRLSMPQVESIGLGSGSIVRVYDTDRVIIGPDSVGNDFEKSVVGGGNVLTTSDISVYKELEGQSDDEPIYAIGNKKNVKDKVTPHALQSYSRELSQIIEAVIDRMKTSPQDMPVLLVGGGSFILPKEIKGASEVWRPRYYQIANAIGAAIGKISATSQTFGNPDDRDSIIESLKGEASNKAILSGALESSITIVDVSTEDVPYTNLRKFEVKVIADVDYSKLSTVAVSSEEETPENDVDKDEVYKNAMRDDQSDVLVDYVKYKPFVNNKKEWIISRTDLEFIKIGTYILGCGGGGDPYPQYLISRNVLENGGVMRVVDVDYRNDYSSISVGFVGTPTVANERLQGTEIITAYNLLNFGDEIESVVGLEIGGGNGFQALLLGAQLDKKILDADLMGRAYPMIWQITPVVLSNETFFSPFAFSDGNGNDVLVKKTKSNQHAESLIRVSLSELGGLVGMVSLIKDAQSLVIKNSYSLAWRIGRAVSIARQKSDIDNLPEYIIESVKPTTAKKLFQGKIIGIDKRVQKGYFFGEVTIEASDKSKMTIPFQNENLAARLEDGTVVASVPDLIAVIDAGTGEALGTPDYRYGLLVHVLAVSPSHHWTDTEKALKLGGPEAFDLDDVQYKPIGHYEKPLSVIEQYFNDQ